MAVATISKSLKTSVPKSMSAEMYQVNDYVVYPGHGVAQINRMVQKNVGKDQLNFYELKIIHKGITALVPEANFAAVGIRPVSSKVAIKKMLEVIAEPVKPVIVVGASWGRRNRDYTNKISRGSLLELAEIYRGLKTAGQYKELSFGEKAFATQVETLLVEEISVVERCSPEDALAILRRGLPGHSHQ